MQTQKKMPIIYGNYLNKEERIMVWQDIIINRKLTKEEIIKSLSSAFNINYDEIYIVKTIEDLSHTIDEKYKIVTKVSIINLDYKMILTIFIRDESLFPDDDIEIAGKISDKLKCKILLSDDDINPNTMVEVQGSDNYKKVTINYEAYEKAEDYLPF